MEWAIRPRGDGAYITVCDLEYITCDCVVFLFVNDASVWAHPWGLKLKTKTCDLGMFVCEGYISWSPKLNWHTDGLLIESFTSTKNEHLDLRFIRCRRKKDPKQQWLFVLSQDEQLQTKLLPMKKPTSLNLDWFCDVLPSILHPFIADYYGPIYFDTVEQWLERNHFSS